MVEGYSRFTMAKTAQTTPANCNKCHGERNHKVLCVRTTTGSRHDTEWYRISGEMSVRWSDTYMMMQCLGCESINFQHVHWFEPTEEYDVTDYPPPSRRPLPEMA